MMPGYKRLWLLVEGNDDARFADAILKPEFGRVYDHVETWQYSQIPIPRRVKFIRSIHAMRADYILLCDIDDFPCVTRKKESMIAQLPTLTDDKIAVVVQEIESWYLAGLDEETCQALDLDVARVRRPDEILKETFDALVGGKINHTAMMVEILKRYDITQARRRSPSFGHFARKRLGG